MTYTTPVPTSNHTQSAVPTPARIGQATAVEQSRAVAEVQAAIVVAQQFPRDVMVAESAMRDSCSILTFAERAFYRYPRGGQTVTGASVHLARELARCWGNIDYGIAEMRRDDEAAQSEMTAWAWDQQTNARSRITFIVPHKRDKRAKRGEDRTPEVLIDLRDIYENNANMGARRLREAIFSILPRWFIDNAERACIETIERGDGRPIEERRDKAVEMLAELGVTVKQIEAKLEKSKAAWTPHDLGKLATVYQSLKRGEIAIEDEFPTAQVTAAEVRAAVPTPPPAQAQPEPAPAKVEEPPPVERDPLEAPTTAGALKALLKSAPAGYGATITKVDETIGDGDGKFSTPGAILNDPQALDFAMALIEGRES